MVSIHAFSQYKLTHSTHHPSMMAVFTSSSVNLSGLTSCLNDPITERPRFLFPNMQNKSSNLLKEDYSIYINSKEINIREVFMKHSVTIIITAKWKRVTGWKSAQFIIICGDLLLFWTNPIIFTSCHTNRKKYLLPSTTFNFPRRPLSRLASTMPCIQLLFINGC